MNFLAVMALPLLACLLLTLILPALGRHVLARGVIFVDLALAQIAALGQSVAFLMGADPHDPSTYFWSFGFTLLGAALFSFLWDREHSVLQEAFIGISFALATAATLLLLSNAPHGAEHVSGTLSGEALGWVTWKDITIMAALFAIVGTFLFLGRRKLRLCSEDPKQARQMGLSVKKWDFLFYASFGLVVTSSVKVSGVLAVFSYLIVPVVCATLLGRRGPAQLYWAWAIAFVVSILGAVFSYLKDWPMGATIVCLFGIAVIIVSLSVRMKYVDDAANGHRGTAEEFGSKRSAAEEVNA
ncbi:MAG: metal ABC transporter permease [Candidatus Eisenbacteria bacterium]|uniref:Metal ABC transporter permease n=1 Tax=Eiseniibacteriota bacterium TaxID=2212470 RepID=A0A538U3W8_UNCEI|nr:MAG: metal ABC transporter permease [Candidatus Eisenbacteria bacterium]